jgi:hypothetical protein
MGILLHLILYLGTSALEKDASFIEQLCGEATLLSQQAKQQVVNSDVLVGQTFSLFGGIGQHTLAFAGLSAFGSNRGIPHTSGSWEYGRGYLLFNSHGRLHSSCLVGLVQRNQQHESYDPDRDWDVREVITKFDFPREPATTSNVKENVERNDRNEY